PLKCAPKERDLTMKRSVGTWAVLKTRSIPTRPAIAIAAAIGMLTLPTGALGSTLLTAQSENVAPPATKLLSASLVSPSAGRTYFGASTTHTVGLTGLPSPEITAVAKTLKGQRNLSVPADLNAFVQNVADYVRNNVA